jgi:hypothetical protein
MTDSVRGKLLPLYFLNLDVHAWLNCTMTLDINNDSILQVLPMKLYLIYVISHFCSVSVAVNAKDIEDEEAKELEHSMLQDSMDKELSELNRRLEQKEVLNF